MTDIIERAEAEFKKGTVTALVGLFPELVAELKAARAELDQLKGEMDRAINEGDWA